MIQQPPTGWIPPEYREFVEAPLSESDMAAIAGTCGTLDPETGELRPWSLAEMRAMGIRKIVGVVDSRDGSFHPTQAARPPLIMR